MSSASLTKSSTKGVVLARDHAVEARQRLHRLHAVEPLVHVHRAQQRLVEAGLVLVGHQQHLVVGRGEALRQLLLADRLAAHHIGVHPRLGVFQAGVRIAHRAAEGHQRADVRVAVLGDVALEGLLVAHRVQARGRSPPSPWPARRAGACTLRRKCSTITSVFCSMLCGCRLMNLASARAAFFFGRSGSSSTALISR